MSEIILSTLNARYIHSSLGLRYLKANMGELIDKTEIIEFIINNRPIDIAERLLKDNPAIIGLGIYIWNVEQSTQLVSLLKTIRPEITIVLGGPEVSFEHDQQKIVELADYVITGQADLAFAELCEKILKNKNRIEAEDKIIKANPVPLPFLNLPYEYYTDEDVKNRVIYVEASRGCPFKCEFCLSSLDKTAWPFDLEIFLAEMNKLYERGIRDFKFIDRTFNLKIQSSIKILEFFLNKMDKNLYLHFELIPDHLPEKLKSVLEKFPEGSLQFEIGIQTFNPKIQTLISRKQNNDKSKENIRWLRENTSAHLHTDIIMGLPGETVESIASSFNELVSLNPHEIQMGILKRLRGTPMIRHTDEYDMRYNPEAPYNILSNKQINFQ
ncbi:MAG: radical SAM protein, partial [Gammaproteobacteria bacterium]|nr:radical SAM protein [Gammaproteobacteria bacterium]